MRRGLLAIALSTLAGCSLFLDSGHLGLWAERSDSGEPLLVARFQNGTDSTHRCAALPSFDQWVHVGINVGVGGFELWVDGARADYTGAVDVDGLSNISTCVASDEAPFENTLADNPNPWVIGASSGGSVEGTADPLRTPFADGAVDNLRLWDRRQTF